MHYILVAGEGDTSRENVEAILEDYFYANKGQSIVMIVPFYVAPSRGQVYAMQMAKDSRAEVVVYAPQSGRLDNVEKSSIEFTDAPISDAINLIKDSKAAVYVLWSEAGKEAFETVSFCRDLSLSAYDLTAGGIPLTNAIQPYKEPVSTPEPSTKADPIQEALNGLVAAIKESILNGSK